MSAGINRKLNLVVPIELDDRKLYAHSVPLGRETFEMHFDVLSRTFAVLYGRGLSFVAGPKVAKLTLKEIAQTTRKWDGELGVERSLLPEIFRLTNVVMPKPDGGWGCVPFEDAIKMRVFEGYEDELADVEGEIVYFMVASAMHRRKELREILDGLVSFWEVQPTSFSVTEFVSSLLTSTPAGNTGAKETPSSIPY